MPAILVHEESDLVAFNDIRPAAPVHILIVPKEHIESIDHLKPEHAKIASKLLFAAQKIAADKKIDGYKLVFNVGRNGGQIIDHLHLHLLAGWQKAPHL